jgi:periplasmic protein TonB
MKLLLILFLLPFAGRAQSTIPQAQSVDTTARKPMMFIEQMPYFPGGETALMNYLGKNIRYPAEAVDNGIEGVVIVRFVVAADGSVTDIEVLRSPGGGTAEEAVRVVRAMPKWKPGMSDGVAVPVYYHLPINFNLNAEKQDKTTNDE